MERRSILVAHLSKLLVSILVLGLSERCLATHRLGEVAESVRICEIELLAGIVRQHPGKDRILGQIIERSSCHGVNKHQILEVRHFALDPSLSGCKRSTAFDDTCEPGSQCLRCLFWIAKIVKAPCILASHGSGAVHMWCPTDNVAVQGISLTRTDTRQQIAPTVCEEDLQ